MKQITFIHTSDLHLGTPFKGLASLNPDLADRIKSATYDAFSKIVDLCIADRVDFLIIAGDVFDSEHQSLVAQLKLLRELERLADAGIPAYIIAGNHDPYPKWPQIPDSLKKFVHIFGHDEVGKKEYNKDGEHLVSVYGISFAASKVKKNLAKMFKKDPDPAPFSIAILHGTVGNPGPHENYAPFKLEDILSESFDYWALGHIHKHQIIREAFPAVVYSGNPQGRDFGEKGERGCYKVTLTENNHPEIEFIPVHTIRFEDLNINCTGVESVNTLRKKIEENIETIQDENAQVNLFLRVNLEGSTPLHAGLQNEDEVQELQKMLNDEWGQDEPFVWIDRIEVNTTPEFDLESMKHQSDFVGELIKEFELMNTNPDELDAMWQTIETIPGLRKVLREGLIIDPKEILDQSQWLILEKLLRNKS